MAEYYKNIYIKYKNNINLILFLSIIISAVFSSFIASFSLILIFIIFNFSIKNNKKNEITNDTDIINFINNLAKKYKRTKNLLSSIKYVNSGNFYFSYTLTNSIIKYGLGYSASDAFSNFYHLGSEYLSQLASLIIIGLDEGVDIYAPLYELMLNIKKKQKRFLKSYGLIKNMQSINMLSAALFLPLFSGISLNIIKFSEIFNISNNDANSGINLLIIIFICYFFILNYMNIFTKKKKDYTLFLFYSAVSITVFLFTFKFVSNMW